MTDLTELWYKGELPYGRYYVELAYNGNNIIMAEYWWDKTLTLDDHEYSRKEVKRILEKVPSYEEWQRLKELLGECRSSVLFEADVMKETSGKNSKDYKMLASILTKIDNAIGGKK